MQTVALAALLALTLLSAPALAQPCPDFGSQAHPATWSASPVTMPCPSAVSWPQWHLYTPRHRAPTPHTGFRPGQVRELRALLVPYACTGLDFAPVRLLRVRVMGYVVDMQEVACQ